MSIHDLWWWFGDDRDTEFDLDGNVHCVHHMDGKRDIFDPPRPMLEVLTPDEVVSMLMVVMREKTEAATIARQRAALA